MDGAEPTGGRERGGSVAVQELLRSAQRRVKTAQRVLPERAVLGDSRSDQRVGELQEQSASGAEHEDVLAIDPPERALGRKEAQRVALAARGSCHPCMRPV